MSEAKSMREVMARHSLEIVLQAIKTGNKILVCGNGGSAAMASHFVAELVVRYSRNRRALPAISLAADQAVITACANDFGYAEVFARQVEALGMPGDVLLALTTSGKSENVSRAIFAAQKSGMKVLIGPYDHHLPTAVNQEDQMRWLHHLAMSIEEEIIRADVL